MNARSFLKLYDYTAKRRDTLILSACPASTFLSGSRKTKSLMKIFNEQISKAGWLKEALLTASLLDNSQRKKCFKKVLERQIKEGLLDDATETANFIILNTQRSA